MLVFKLNYNVRMAIEWLWPIYSHTRARHLTPSLPLTTQNKHEGFRIFRAFCLCLCVYYNDGRIVLVRISILRSNKIQYVIVVRFHSYPITIYTERKYARETCVSCWETYHLSMITDRSRRASRQLERLLLRQWSCDTLFCMFQNNMNAEHHCFSTHLDYW